MEDRSRKCLLFNDYFLSILVDLLLYQLQLLTGAKKVDPFLFFIDQKRHLLPQAVQGYQKAIKLVLRYSEMFELFEIHPDLLNYLVRVLSLAREDKALDPRLREELREDNEIVSAELREKICHLVEV